MAKKCCEDYNGTLDITNSCLFCKTHLGKKIKAINTRTPNPGSQEARDLGCKCPVMDNNYGRGYYEDGKTFVYAEDCPLHSSGVWINKNGLQIK